MLPMILILQSMKSIVHIVMSSWYYCVMVSHVTNKMFLFAVIVGFLTGGLTHHAIHVPVGSIEAYLVINKPIRCSSLQ